MAVRIERDGPVFTVVLSRPAARNAVDRPVGAEEAFAMGLANRIVPAGESRAAAEALAREIAAFPQVCLRGDRRSVYESFGMPLDEALLNELQHGTLTLASGESEAGARRFTGGEGRHGGFGEGEGESP